MPGRLGVRADRGTVRGRRGSRSRRTAFRRRAPRVAVPPPTNPAPCPVDQHEPVPAQRPCPTVHVLRIELAVTSLGPRERPTGDGCDAGVLPVLLAGCWKTYLGEPFNPSPTEAPQPIRLCCRAGATQAIEICLIVVGVRPGLYKACHATGLAASAPGLTPLPSGSSHPYPLRSSSSANSRPPDFTIRAPDRTWTKSGTM